MSEFENFNGEDTEELENIIVLTDEDGQEVAFEFLSLIEYDGNEYVVLLPVDDEDESGEVVILQVEEAEDPELENYVAVDDENVLMNVFEIFKEKFKDEFNFSE